MDPYFQYDIIPEKNQYGLKSKTLPLTVAANASNNSKSWRNRSKLTLFKLKKNNNKGLSKRGKET